MKTGKNGDRLIYSQSTRCPAPARSSSFRSTPVKARSRCSSWNTSTKKKPRPATWYSSCAPIRIRTKAASSPSPPAIKLNREFNYLIHLSPGGALGVSAAGYQWDSQISATWRNKPLYFKAGVYVQDNTGYTSEGGQVTFSKLDIDHDK